MEENIRAACHHLAGLRRRKFKLRPEAGRTVISLCMGVDEIPRHEAAQTLWLEGLWHPLGAEGT